ncbi:MAG: CBS domain-containing protein [Bacteroidota bacterium]
MNLRTPIAELMTKKLYTVNPEDSLQKVDELFRTHRIHHMPVVRFRKIVGIISQSDLLYFLKGLKNNEGASKTLNTMILNHYKASDIMTTGLAKVESTDRINVALEVFKENLFHALPVVDNDELVGIVTTYDIIKALADGALVDG